MEKASGLGSVVGAEPREGAGHDRTQVVVLGSRIGCAGCGAGNHRKAESRCRGQVRTVHISPGEQAG